MRSAPRPFGVRFFDRPEAESDRLGSTGFPPGIIG